MWVGTPPTDWGFVMSVLRNFASVFGLTISATIGTTIALGSEGTPVRYTKDASQFCFPKLNAEEQVKYYSRIMNVGASYTHGCIGCDQNANLRSYTELTNDQLWFRRNYLVHFLANVQWKQPGYGIADKLAVLENDPKNRPAALIPDWSLQREGYTGEWIYDIRRDVAHLSDPAMSRWLSENTAYGAAKDLVGGPLNVRDLGRPRAGLRRGSLYQTFRTNGPNDPNSPRVIDLSLDGGRMHDFFDAYVSPDIMVPLQKSKWTNPVLRRKAVEAAIVHVKSLNPSVIMAIDALFWDSVSHALAYMRESKPNSLVVRALLNIMAMQDKNGFTFDETRRFNVSEDFYQVLKGISQENQYGPSVPVLIARLINNPLEVFAQKKYEPVLGAIFGQYLATMTGQNFSEQLALWLRKMSNVGSKPGLLSGDDYFDPETQTTYSAEDLAFIRQANEEFKQLTNEKIEEMGLATRGLAPVESNRPEPATQKSGPGILTAITNWAILKAVKDLPLFMQSLERAMQYENRGIRALTSQTDNNVHLVNVDKFFENFPYFLKPETMHPSVFGSKQMAGMINKAVCQSVGQQ
jgi:ribosomal protein S24E